MNILRQMKKIKKTEHSENSQYSNEIRKTEENNHAFVKYMNKYNFKINILFRTVFLSFSG